MDQMFFAWLAAQPYSVEVAIGATFVVLIAPAILGGMAALASWVEHLIGELLRMAGLLEPLEREKKTLWRLRAHPTSRSRWAKPEDKARPGPRAAG